MPEVPRGEIEALIRQGRQMDAIKRLRRTKGLDLRQAAEEIERIESRLAGWAPDSHAQPEPTAGPSQKVLAQVRFLALQGRKMEAIKLLDERAGMGLRQAKDLVEAVTRQARRGSRRPW